MTPKNHLSLFSGMGGFDLAAERTGYTNVAHCEINPFCRQILHHYWPNAISYEDIYETDFSIWRDRIHTLTAGFPCQPFSVAGQQLGAQDDRYLWPETLRAITEARPGWVILENVAGLTGILEPRHYAEMEKETVRFRGTDNEVREVRKRWKQQRILGIIIQQLEKAGYDFPRHADGTPVILCVPACAVQAPHRRDRLWIVAYRDGQQYRASRTGGEVVGNGGDLFQQPQPRRQTPQQPARCNGVYNGTAGVVADANGKESGRLRSGKEKAHPITGFEDSDTTPHANGTRRLQHNQRTTDVNEKRHGQGETGEWENLSNEHRSNTELPTPHPHPNGQPQPQGQQPQGREWVGDGTQPIADAQCQRPQGQGQHRGCGHPTQNGNGQTDRSFDADKFKTSWVEAASLLCRMDDGIPDLLDVNAVFAGVPPHPTRERNQRDAYTRWRKEAIKAAGNSIVSGIAEMLMRAIAVADLENHNYFEI